MPTEDKKQSYVGAWEGSMSERKSDYYAKHLQQLQEQVSTNEQVAMVQPAGLPTFLAKLVNEYHQALDLATFNVDEAPLVADFNRALLTAAQPLLTEHLNKLANPPMVLNTYQHQAQADVAKMRRDHYEWYCRNCRDQQINALPYEAWLNDGANVHPKVTVRDLTVAERERLADERRKREIAGSFYTRNGEE